MSLQCVENSVDLSMKMKVKIGKKWSYSCVNHLRPNSKKISQTLVSVPCFMDKFKLALKEPPNSC